MNGVCLLAFDRFLAHVSLRCRDFSRLCYRLFAEQFEGKLTQPAATFVLAPVPNSLCHQCSGADDFSADYSSAPADFGRFLTAIIVCSGLALPLVLAHSEVIHPVACWMSIAGGVLVYGTSACPRLCGCG